MSGPTAWSLSIRSRYPKLNLRNEGLLMNVHGSRVATAMGCSGMYNLCAVPAQGAATRRAKGRLWRNMGGSVVQVSRSCRSLVDVGELPFVDARQGPFYKTIDRAHPHHRHIAVPLTPLGSFICMNSAPVS